MAVFNVHITYVVYISVCVCCGKLQPAGVVVPSRGYIASSGQDALDRLRLPVMINIGE